MRKVTIGGESYDAGADLPDESLIMAYVDDELDEEVRRKIKNLEEGTATWEIEYSKVLDQMKRNRGLE